VLPALPFVLLLAGVLLLRPGQASKVIGRARGETA
jgi:hypothetical protein